MTNATLQSWARALGGEVSGAQVLCPGPGHSAEDRSLSVTIGRDGEPIVHSFSGDDWKLCRDYVRSRSAWSHSSRKPKRANTNARGNRRKLTSTIVTKPVPSFTRSNARIITTVAKRRFTLGDRTATAVWITGKGCMAGVPRVPYRLPEAIEVVANGN